MATSSNILAWRIPWTEEPDGHKESDTTEHAHVREKENIHLQKELYIHSISCLFILVKD